MKRFANLLILSILFFSTVNIAAQTVYITKTGSKYHSDGCRYLSKSKISIDLATAISKGYCACSVCKPPTQVSSAVKSPDIKSEKTNPSDNQSNVTNSTKTTTSGKTIMTGPRGGQYYINSQGKKVYVKKK
jgi:hypothetical protein